MYKLLIFIIYFIVIMKLIILNNINYSSSKYVQNINNTLYSLPTKKFIKKITNSIIVILLITFYILIITVLYYKI